MFEIERFIEQCRLAVKERDAQRVVRELVEEAVSDPAQLMRAIGEPQRAGLNKIYVADDLTILNLCWGPQMNLQPHDHRMWAVIGMYGGQEDNGFYRRKSGGLEPVGGKELPAGDVLVMGDDVIHSVANTKREFAVALHVYGGDFFSGERSEWTFDTFEERPRDVAGSMRLFEEANARWAREQHG